MSRTIARNAAMQMIFERDAGGQGGEETLRMIYDEMREEALTPIAEDDPSVRDRAYIQAALEGVEEHLEEIDGQLQKHSRNWSVERMGSVERSIMRLAAWEILYAADWDVPGAVAISQAVLLARQYADEDSCRFVNGLLGNLLRDKEAHA